MSGTLVVIVGPTAVGKTALAIELAGEFCTVIISADSRQFYREMRIGTARPETEETGGIKHYFSGHLGIEGYYNASMFEEAVMKLLPELFKNHGHVILAGGSGLYVNAVIHGIDDLPGVDPLVRRELAIKFEKEGIRGLRDMLEQLDPDYYARVDLNNPKRILKGLEVSIMTGRPYSGFLTHRCKERDFQTVLIGLDRPRKELYQRINRRVDQMMAQGLLEEARGLYPLRHLNALNTVGYQELFCHFEGKISLEEAVEQIKSHTRQYARKQLTWFRKNPGFRWFHPDEKQNIIDYIQALN